MRTIEDRFWEKVDTSGGDDACWLWTASLDGRGYGQFGVKRETDGKYIPRRAHRIAYELLGGTIPDGLDLDHLCRVRACVNPAHLEPVTRQENLLRGQTLAAENAVKTHCPRGHALTAENTNVRPGDNPGMVKRTCRTCTNNAQRGYDLPTPTIVRTHCKNGHPFTPENRNANRACRICANEASRRHRERKRQASA